MSALRLFLCAMPLAALPAFPLTAADAALPRINVRAVRKEGGIARRILGVSFAAGFITISLSSAWALAQTTQAPPSVLALKPQASPFAWSATENPLVPVLATDGQYHLEYQLLFVNEKAFAATLTSGEVLDPETETPTGNNTALSADGTDVRWTPIMRQPEPLVKG